MNFNFLYSSNVEEEEHDSAFTEEAVQSRELKEKRTAFRSSRSKSESSAVSGDSAARYISWENVSFLGHELRKTVRKGFHWLAYTSPGKNHKKVLNPLCCNLFREGRHLEDPQFLMKFAIRQTFIEVTVRQRTNLSVLDFFRICSLPLVKVYFVACFENTRDFRIVFG